MKNNQTELFKKNEMTVSIFLGRGDYIKKIAVELTNYFNSNFKMEGFGEWGPLGDRSSLKYRIVNKEKEIWINFYKSEKMQRFHKQYCTYKEYQCLIADYKNKEILKDFILPREKSKVAAVIIENLTGCFLH